MTTGGVSGRAEAGPSVLAAVVRRLDSEVWNAGRAEVAVELIHPEFAYAARPDLRGPDAKLAAVRGYRAMFPDMHFTVEDIVAGPERVAARTTLTCTDTGGLAGRPATGRSLSAWSVEFFGFRDGLIVSDWVGNDWLGLFVQAGAVADPWAR